MIIKLTCIATAFSIIGGPMAIYQAFAWSKMIHDRIPQQGIAEALDSTFSGDAPCQHCHKITLLKKQQADAPKNNHLPDKIEIISIAKIAPHMKKIAILGPHSKKLGFIFPSIPIPDSRVTQCPTPPPRDC